MKKIWLLLISVFCSIQASALYMGNPTEPDLIEKGFFLCSEDFLGFKIGYQGDYVIDRRLKAYDGSRGRIDDFSILLNQGMFALSFMERAEVYGTVGTMEVAFSNRPKPDGQRREYQSNAHTSWGVGGRVILFEWGNTTLGIAGGFQWANPHIKWNALNGVPFTTGAVMRYREWQVGLGVSHRIDFLVPYAAVKYSNVHAFLSQLRPNLGLPQSSFRMRNRDYFGLVLGCSITTGHKFDVTVETQMIDEQAISLAGNIKF